MIFLKNDMVTVIPAVSRCGVVVKKLMMLLVLVVVGVKETKVGVWKEGGGYGNYPQNLVVWARDLATRLWVSMHGICGICGVLFGYVG